MKLITTITIDLQSKATTQEIHETTDIMHKFFVVELRNFLAARNIDRTANMVHEVKLT